MVLGAAAQTGHVPRDSGHCHPGIGGAVLDRLGPRDVPEVLSFLENDPVLNVYLIALVLRDALARPNDAWWGARRSGQLSAVLYVGVNSGAVLPSGRDEEALTRLGECAARELAERPARVQLIGPDTAVAAVREHFPGPELAPRLERSQVYLSLARTPGPAGTLCPELRTARREDYAFLYHAGAELRFEELLEDPREVDVNRCPVTIIRAGLFHLRRSNMAHLVETMAYTNATPWHGLGHHLPENQPLEVWLREAGMQWEIKSTEVLYQADGEGTGFNIRPNKDAKVLYRSDSLEPLSDVSNRYKVVQPLEILEFYRDLVEAGGFELETAGVLKGGRKLWALARTGQEMFLKGNDQVKGYLLLGTACDGTLATVAQFTSVRVVCEQHPANGGWGFLRGFLTLPFFGLQLGLRVLQTFLGGRLTRAVGLQIGRDSVRLSRFAGTMRRILKFLLPGVGHLYLARFGHDFFLPIRFFG